MQKNKSINKEGIGLGLYITKNLVEQLNGKITVDSIEDQYTRFTVTLPVTNKFHVDEEKMAMLKERGVIIN